MPMPNPQPPFPLRQALRRVGWATAALLLVPLVAMAFTPEVRWGPGDFMAAAAVLLATGTGAVVAWRHARGAAAGAAGAGCAAAAVVLLGALVWAELAVGLFD
jgi:hypothetical protein